MISGSDPRSTDLQSEGLQSEGLQSEGLQSEGLQSEGAQPHLAKAGRALPIAVTMGEPAGIGGELTLRAWLDRSDHQKCFFAIDDPSQLKLLAKQLGIEVPIVTIEHAREAGSVFPDALPVLPISLKSEVRYGKPDTANASCVLASIEKATQLVLSGEADAILTNPIQKKPLYDFGFTYQGHTDFLEDLTESRGPAVMMLAIPGLRVVPVTVHIPLSEVPKILSVEIILSHGRVTAHALKNDFGIPRPRISIAGLNPHSGEAGSIGREEIEIIQPALERLRSEGIQVEGPLPADSLFHPRARAQYDAVLCMYHDQALIPLKAIDFDRGVNITLGLPIVRTSPDHGTALDIAGTGEANIESFLAALKAAADIARNRSA